MYSSATLVAILACIHCVGAQFTSDFFNSLPFFVQATCKFEVVSKPTFKIEGDVLSTAESNAGAINDVTLDADDQNVSTRFVQFGEGHGVVIEGIAATQVFVQCKSFVDDPELRKACEKILPWFEDTRKGCNNLRNSVSIAKVNARFGKVRRESLTINTPDVVGSAQLLQFQGKGLDAQLGDQASTTDGEGNEKKAQALTKVSVNGQEDVQVEAKNEATVTEGGSSASSSVKIAGGK